MALGKLFKNFRPSDQGFEILSFDASRRCVLGPNRQMMWDTGCLIISSAELSEVATTYVTYDILEKDPETGELFDVNSPLLRVEPFLEINWSSEQDLHTAEVDLRRGVWFAVPAFFENVKLVYPAVLNAVQPPLSVSIGLGRGNKSPPGMTGVPTRTLVLTAGGDGTTVDLPIPKLAVTMVLANDDIAAIFTPVRFKLANGGPVINASPVGKLDSQSLPITQGAQFFDAGVPAGATQMRAVFFLAL